MLSAKHINSHRNSEYPKAVAPPQLYFNIVDMGVKQNLLYVLNEHVYVGIKPLQICVLIYGYYFAGYHFIYNRLEIEIFH